MIQEKQVELLALLMILGSYEGNEPIEYEGKLYDIVKMRERGCELMSEFLSPYVINKSSKEQYRITVYRCTLCNYNCKLILKNLTLNLEEEIALLTKYRITPNELMIVRTLLILQDEDTEELFKSYIELLYDCGTKLREILLSLQEKGIILKSYKIPLIQWLVMVTLLENLLNCWKLI